MDKKSTFRLLRESWGRCEEIVHALGMRGLDGLVKKLGATTIEDVLSFLHDIEFVEDAKLTEFGSDFFLSRFILNDEDASNKILLEAMKQYEPTQVICQLLWGRPGLRRINLYKLLVFEEYIDQDDFGEDDLGSFLMLLNQCGIIKYSKKTNDVKVTYNPRTSDAPKPLTRFLSPETPYSNLRNLWDVLRNCTGFIHWFDKHFSAKGLEPLHDEADGTKVSEIKILTGIISSGVNDKLRRDFERFKGELKIRKIDCELRVICEKELLNTIHDRWIVSERTCYNVPPVDSMFMGQYSELKQTTNRPPFAEWWERGSDILSDWQKIFSHL